MTPEKYPASSELTAEEQELIFVRVSSPESLSSILQKQLNIGQISWNHAVMVYPWDVIHILPSQNKITIRRTARQDEKHISEEYTLRDLSKEEKEDSDFRDLFAIFKHTHGGDISENSSKEEQAHFIYTYLHHNAYPVHVGIEGNIPVEATIPDALIQYNKYNPDDIRHFLNPDKELLQLPLTKHHVVYFETYDVNRMVLHDTQKGTFRCINLTDMIEYIESDQKTPEQKSVKYMSNKKLIFLSSRINRGILWDDVADSMLT